MSIRALDIEIHFHAQKVCETFTVCHDDGADVVFKQYTYTKRNRLYNRSVRIFVSGHGYSTHFAK